MKYIVGLPVSENAAFIENVIKNRQHIKEVYFSFGDSPSGRSALSSVSNTTPFEAEMNQANALRKLCDAGIGLNLLFNANCYGRDAQSRAFFGRVGDLVDYIAREYKLLSVTTSSPLIAKFIKENFEGIDVRASVNMEIGTVEGISYVADYFDSFYVRREANRSLKTLLELRRYCDGCGKEMYLLANSGCLNNCSAHIFHDNLVAHEKEISAMDNGYQFNGICWDFLSKKDSLNSWLQNTNFIRPEDIGLYENITPAVKLATRVNSSPSRILGAYIDGRYRGSVMEILEPNHSSIFYPSYIENSNFNKDFAKRVMTCDKNCRECGFCTQTTNDACIKLASDPSETV